MSKQITITFQASRELRDFLAGKARQSEMTLGGFVRYLCAAAKIGDAVARPIMEAEQLVPRGRILTVSEAKRRAKGKAPR